MLRLSILGLLLLCLLPHEASSCTLCPLRVPPRPRPLNQYQLPVIPEFNTEKMPQFCNHSRNLPVSEKCRRGFEKILCSADKALETLSQCSGPEDPEKCNECVQKWEGNKWVREWVDSLGKPGAGVSDGNYYWLGDYETCQDLRVSNTFEGKYCRIELEVPDSLVEVGCPQTDPLAINLGVCFPSQCTAEELEQVSSLISAYPLRVACEFDVKWSTGAYIFIVICFIWFAIQLLFTVCSPMQVGGMRHMAKALSLTENAKMSLSTKRERTDGLHALQGLESIAFFTIILGNVYNYMMPYIENVAFSFEGVSNLPMHLTNNFSYQVDGLFALSSVYTTFLLYGNLQSWSQTGGAIVKRFVRFWPAYVFCVLFMLFVFVGIAAGPMWIHADTVTRCQRHWWKNILFINDFFEIEDTCVDFGYIISMEAQFFVLLVVLIYIARSHRNYAKYFAYFLIAGSTIWTFVNVYFNNLPPVPILTAEPIPLPKLKGIMSIMSSAHLRVAPYLIGFLFGITMSEQKGRQSKERASVCDKVEGYLIVAMILLSGAFVLFSMLPYASHAMNQQFFLSFYAAVHRPMWSCCLLAFLYLCEHGWFAWINAILTWRIFSPLSKLTWIALVMSEPIILYFFTSLNRPSYATHWSLVYSAISAATMSYLLAFAVDVFLTRPIRQLLFPEASRTHQPVPTRDVPLRSHF